MKITTAVFALSAFAGSSAIPLATVEGNDVGGKEAWSTSSQAESLVLTLERAIERDRLAMAVRLSRLRARCTELRMLHIEYSEPGCVRFSWPQVAAGMTDSSRSADRQPKGTRRSGMSLASSLQLGGVRPGEETTGT